MFFYKHRLKKFFTDKGSFDKKLAILGASVIDSFDFLNDVRTQHEVVGKFADLTFLNHLFID